VLTFLFISYYHGFKYQLILPVLTADVDDIYTKNHWSIPITRYLNHGHKTHNIDTMSIIAKLPHQFANVGCPFKEQ